MANNFSNAINSNIGASNSGATNTLTVTNPSNTASSGANVNVTVGGTSAGDAFQTFTVSGTTNWSQGVDNSVTSPAADPFVISASTALGTTNVMTMQKAGQVNMPLQPAFLATHPTVDTNVTGTGQFFTLGSGSTLTIVYDQNSNFVNTGTFTAPVAGKYFLALNVTFTGVSVAYRYLLQIVTTARTYQNDLNTTPNAAVAEASSQINALADMSAGDTATFVVYVAGQGTQTISVLGSATRTYMYGYLVC